MTTSSIPAVPIVIGLLALATVAATAQDKDGLPAHLVGITADQARANEFREDAGRRTENGDVQGAIELLEIALVLDPNDVVPTRMAHRVDMRYPTYRALAELLVHQKRYREALETYGRLLVRMSEADPSVWCEIAKIWEAAGEHDRALAYYWRAAKEGYDPDAQPRRFLVDAFRRIAPQRLEELLKEELSAFEDWVSYYHLAQFYDPGNTDRPTSETIPALERSMVNYEKAIETLGARGDRRHFLESLQAEYERVRAVLAGERTRQEEDAVGKKIDDKRR